MNDTIFYTPLTSALIGSRIGNITNWVTDIQNASIGTTTWASTTAMLVEILMWMWVLLRGGNERKVKKRKKEIYVEGSKLEYQTG